MNEDNIANTLIQGHCVPCEGGLPPLNTTEAKRLMSGLHADWQLLENGKAIVRELSFANFYETMAFVNAVAWIAHREDHHPDLQVGYNQCHVRYSTHAIGGLSQNDFICAARVDALGL